MRSTYLTINKILYVLSIRSIDDSLRLLSHQLVPIVLQEGPKPSTNFMSIPVFKKENINVYFCKRPKFAEIVHMNKCRILVPSLELDRGWTPTTHCSALISNQRTSAFSVVEQFWSRIESLIKTTTIYVTSGREHFTDHL